MQKYEVFPGLKPTSQLYFDLQAMIAENGGRSHLADILESEMVKEYLPRKVVGNYDEWSADELRLLIKLYPTTKDTEQMLYINRTIYAIRSKTHELQMLGIIQRKQIRKSK